MVALIAIVHANGGQFAGTAWALLPPFVAIILALVTKEAYSSLFIGVLLGAFMAADCSILGTVDTVTEDALIKAVTGTAGIFIFLVILGIIVALVNKSGASRAFGEWAQKHIKTRTGAMLATFALGVIIFIDDYFNCLTVGSVMTPVTDSKKISRVKLAYLIDATAAPICMIAPVSSWAAAVSGAVDTDTYSGFDLFVRAIPYNFYSLFTLVFIIVIAILGYDYGKMADFEIKAQKTGDLSILNVTNEKRERKMEENGPATPHRGKLYDLIIPIAVLIIVCIWALIRNGMNALGGTATIREAFSETDATVGLPWGSIIALVIIAVYLIIRKVVTFEEAMECIPQGFVAMVPAITILTLATALKNMTNGALNAEAFVKSFMVGAGDLEFALPAVVFLVATVIAFATGTSWGTFGILIPIVTAIFTESSGLFFVGISACLAGAVCGDHCSPISDTTIMSSAGAHCNHIDHVETQLPYALSVAGISFVCYLIAGILDRIHLAWLSIPAGIALTLLFLIVMKHLVAKKQKS
ncbi:MAG: Na+/H+ antiporter NhaC family protein [Lachnospiraceae bacterium]|nr:Na+/H+ antiporter NhaC family protein [Lachnospiraceae bacterium]